MPAITIDASVVDGSNGKLHPTPLPPIYPPTAIAPDSIPATAAPISIGSIAAGSIGAPVVVSAQDAPDVDNPVVIASQAASVISLPSAYTAESAPSYVAPTEYTAETPAVTPAPTIVSPESAPAISTPTVYTANALPSETPPFALNHARIMYRNLLVGSSVSTNNGSNPAYTLIPNTAQRWEPNTNAWVKFILPTNTNIDTVCIGAHNLSAGGYIVTPYYRTTDGGALTAFASAKTPSNDNAIMFHSSSSVSAKVIEVYLTGGSGDAYIGSIYAGIALQMQRPFLGGHSPAVLSRQADYFSSNTESGNFIGVEVRRRALQSNADWKNLSDSWYRTYFDPFLVVAETLPFYFAWNLLEYPNDVVYCKNITNISPQYQGKRDLMSVSIPLVGIA